MFRSTTSFLLCIPLTVLAGTAPAQETYWVGGGAGITRIDAAGVNLQTVTPGTGAPVAVGPDGKVWYVASTSSIRVLNPDGTLFKTITPSSGINAYALAIDKQNHAWVTSNNLAPSISGVEEFDSAGNSLGVLPLTATAPRRITVDSSNNKWIAHRIGPPGSVSRIDGTTKAVTTHTLTGSAMLPIGIVADARGILGQSHIWVTGDNRGAGDLVELDGMGNVLARYNLDPVGTYYDIACDVDATGTTKFVWVGDWRNKKVIKVDAATGVGTAFVDPSGITGMAFDGFGNVWCTASTGGFVRRLDPATGVVEVSSAVGASTEVATRWQFATVVDQLGDLDGDGFANLAEVMAGSSPFDRCSVPSASISIEGPTAIGSNMSISVRAAAGAPTGVALAAGFVATGFPLPGFACDLRLDPLTLAPFLLNVTGPQLIPITIPNNPALIGGKAYVQGLNLAALRFTNAIGVLFY